MTIRFNIELNILSTYLTGVGSFKGKINDKKLYITKRTFDTI